MHYEEEEITRKNIVVFNWTIDLILSGKTLLVILSVKINKTILVKINVFLYIVEILPL
jgi:hypothetical protein